MIINLTVIIIIFDYTLISGGQWRSGCLITREMPDVETVACLLEDALKFRNPACRMTSKHMKVRSWYYSVWVRSFLVFVCLFVLVLPLGEHQHSFSNSSAYDINNETLPDSYSKYFYISITLEAICLIVLTISCAVRLYLVFPENAQQWLGLYKLPFYISEFNLVVFYILALVVTWPIFFTSVLLYGLKGYIETLHELLLVRQLIRPLFLIAHVQLIRKVIKAIAWSFVPILRVMFLLGLIMCLFALIGVMVYSDDESRYFNSIPRAYWSLLIYLTTSNSPDILTSVYSENRVYFIFFGTYFLLGNYFILGTLVVLLAAKFMFYFKQSVERSYKYRLISLRIAFEKLKRTGELATAVKREDIEQALEKQKWSRKKLENCISYRHLSEDLNWNQFRNLCFEVFNASAQTDTESQDKRTVYACGCNIFNIKLIVDVASAIIAFTHIIVITVLITEEEKDKKSLLVAAFAFSFLFALEAIMRLFITPFLYFSTSANATPMLNPKFSLKDAVYAHLHLKNIVLIGVYVVDLAVLLTAMVLGFLHVSCLFGSKSMEDCSLDDSFDIFRITNVLVLFRFMRMVITSRFFSDIISTLLHGAILLIPLGLLAYILYYTFAVIGVFLYQDKIDTGNSSSTVSSAYEMSNYHAFNFNDFASSLVTLWNLMLVNNWFIFVEAFVQPNSIHNGIFFVIWWILTETIFKGILFGTLLYIVQKAFEKHVHLKKNTCKRNLARILLDIFGIGPQGNNGVADGSDFNSLITTWSIYQVKDLNDVDIEIVEREIEHESYAHPDIRNATNMFNIA